MKDGKKRMRQRTVMLIWIPVITVLVAAMIVVTCLMNAFPRVMDFMFGAGEMRTEDAEGTEDWDAEYYTREFTDKAELLAAAQDVTEEIAGEGFVLLKNENGALPLNTSVAKEKAISCFGWAFSHPVYGGTGSGDVDTATCVTPQIGLENAGFTVNPTLATAYDTWSKDPANNYTNAVNTVGNNTTTALMSAFGIQPRVSMSADERPTLVYGYGNWDLIETPVSVLDMRQAREYSDVALVMISRQGGEQGDLPTEMGDNTFYNRGDGVKYGYNADKHYLELTDEEEELLAAVKAQDFEKVVVVINSANVMELGELESDAGVDAIIFAPGAGQTGFNALGKILSGEVVPSGILADIIAADFTADPTFVNFADPANYAYNAAYMRDPAAGKRNSYNNITKENSYDAGFFVQYEEGIYVGYRYYETAAAIGKEGFDYDEAVTYPFGYGESYTTFSQRITAAELSGYDMTVEVEVKNTGDTYTGKEVVQLYVEVPYHAEYGIEKSAVMLVAFGKTEPIAPGGTDIVTLHFTKDDLTSYDYKTNESYVLDDGEYVFSLRSDSHTVITYEGEEQTRTWNNTVREIYNEENDGARQSEKDAQGQLPESEYVAATNALGDSLIESEMEKMTILSRADKFASMPEAATEADRTASDEMVAAAAVYDVSKHVDASDPVPTTGADKTFSLIDMRGLEADDPAWDTLLDQLTFDEMEEMITKSGFGTPFVSSVGSPRVMVNDGPASLAVDWAGTEGAIEAETNAYTCAVAVACTFNTELARRMGQMAGEEALMLSEQLGYPYAGWYAPGVNLHRSPFGGRNFEYYSEDPLLSGKMAAEVIGGAMDKGLYTTMKHFAVNDQETYRGGWGYASNNALYTWADEQTIRELYLRAFEIPVKEATSVIKYISDNDGTVSEKTIRACTGIMTSFNAVGTTWTGGNDGLLNGIVRSEWSFDGVIITDFKNYGRAYMDIDRMVRAGGDVALATEPNPAAGELPLEMGEPESGTTLSAMREACRHLLYATVHSNAMNNVKPGTIISYTLAPWQIVLVVCSVVVYAFAAFVIVMLVLRFLDTKKHPDNYRRPAVK